MTLGPANPNPTTQEFSLFQGQNPDLNGKIFWVEKNINWEFADCHSFSRIAQPPL